MKISDIDKNFEVESSLDNRTDLVYLDPEAEPFKIYGVFRDGDHFVRVPDEIAKTVSAGGALLAPNTAGGRIRFRTDSPYVAIKCIYHLPSATMPHFAANGSKGIDFYDVIDGRNTFVNSFQPPVDQCDGFEASKDFISEGMHEVTVNMPLYHGVKKIYIGLARDAVVLPPTEYAHTTPIVFYGSSITQGGCASRAGMSYQGMLSRWLDTDIINLGFSGNARGEREMVDYFSDIKASVFVCDYDHNAPTLDHLVATLKPLYTAYRAKNPDTPFVFVSRPKKLLCEQEELRRRHIEDVCEQAKAAGDKNVYFIDGRTLSTPELDDEGTVDHTHPTDLGFYFMAKGMYPLLKELIG